MRVRGEKGKPERRQSRGLRSLVIFGLGIRIATYEVEVRCDG